VIPFQCVGLLIVQSHGLESLLWLFNFSEAVLYNGTKWHFLQLRIFSISLVAYEALKIRVPHAATNTLWPEDNPRPLPNPTFCYKLLLWRSEDSKSCWGRGVC